METMTVAETIYNLYKIINNNDLFPEEISVVNNAMLHLVNYDRLTITSNPYKLTHMTNDKKIGSEYTLDISLRYYEDVKNVLDKLKEITIKLGGVTLDTIYYLCMLDYQPQNSVSIGFDSNAVSNATITKTRDGWSIAFKECPKELPEEVLKANSKWMYE